MAEPVTLGASAGEPTPLTPFLRWLAERGDSIVDRMYNAVVTRTPAVVAAGPEDENRLRDALASHLPVVAATVASADIEPRVRLPRAAGRWALSMADRGIEMADLVVAYDAAGEVLLESYAVHLRVVSNDADRADALELAFERLFRYLRAASASAIAAFAKQRELIRQRDASDTRQVLTGILTGVGDEAAAELRLNYRFTATHIGFAIWAHPASVADLERMVDRVRVTCRATQATSARFSQNLIFGWMSCPSDVRPPTLQHVLPAGVRLAFGTPHAGVAGFRATHRETQEAHRVASSPLAGPIVSCFDEIALLAFAGQNTDLTRPWVSDLLGELAEPRNTLLLETVRVWLEELGSPTKTARRLSVHHNTVIKRLERAARLLRVPLDPGSLSLRVAVELAPLAHLRD